MKRKCLGQAAAMALAAALVVCAAAGDEVQMMDGTVLKGTIHKEDDTWIFFRTEAGLSKAIKREDVASIIRKKEAATSKPESKPAPKVKPPAEEGGGEGRVEPRVEPKAPASPPPAAGGGGRFALEHIRRAVVCVQCFHKERLIGMGSGFIVRADGVVYTNRHVVKPPEDSITVDKILVGVPSRKDHRELEYFPAQVAYVGAEEKGLDFAVLKIAAKPAYGTLPVIRVSAQPARMGDDVAVLGFPAGLGDTPSMSFTKGAVSATGVKFEGQQYYQTDAAVNPGNSGGPLVNAAGEAIGLVTLRRTEADNMGYALQLDPPAKVLPRLQGSLAKAQPSPGPITKKDAPEIGAPAGGIPPEAKIRLEEWDFSGAQVAKHARFHAFDGGGGGYVIRTRKTVPEDFRLTLYMGLVFHGNEEAIRSRADVMAARLLLIVTGTDKVDINMWGPPGRSVWWGNEAMLLRADGEAVGPRGPGNTSEPVTFVVTKKGPRYTVSVDGRQMIDYTDPKPVKGRYPIAICGYLSRLYLAGVQLQDLSAASRKAPAGMAGLLGQLKSPDWADRNDALVDLAKLKGAPADAIVAATRDEHPLVRARAVGALAGIEPAGKVVSDALAKALGDETTAVRREALSILAARGKVDAALAPGLIGLLGKPGTRQMVEQASTLLQQIGAPAIPGLVQLLRPAVDLGARMQAQMILQKIGAAASPALIAALADSDAAYRHEVRGVLMNISGAHPEAMKALVGYFSKETNREVRMEILSAASEGFPGGRFDALMLVALRDENANVRMKGLQWFQKQPAGVKAAMADIIKMFEDESAQARREALRTAAAAKAPEAIPGCVKALDDPDEGVRNEAAWAILSTGAPGEAAAAEQFKSGPPRAQAAIVQTLGHRWGNKPLPEALVPGVLAMVKSEDPKVRQQAAQILRHIKSPTPAVAEVLVGLLGEKDRHMATYAAAALRDAPPQTWQYMARAIRKAPDTQSRRHVLGGILQLGEIPEGLLAVLKEMIRENDDFEVRRLSVVALARMKTRASEEALQLAVLDPDPTVAQAAMDALKGSGVSLVKPLLAAAESTDPKVRDRAILALRMADSPQTRAALGKRVKGSDQQVAMLAAIALGNMSNHDLPIETLPLVLRGCSLPDKPTASLARGAMQAFKERAVPALIEAAKTGDEDFRGWAGAQIGQFRTREAIEFAMTRLDDPNWVVRSNSLTRLAEEGFRNDPVVEPKVLLAAGAKLIGDPRPGIREQAVRMVFDIGRKYPDLKADAQAALQKAAGAADSSTRRQARSLLQALQQP